MKHNREFIFGISTVLLLSLACLAQSTAPASRPADDAEPVRMFATIGSPENADLFGDAVNVKLLADIAGDSDPLLREHAIRDLGQTHNVLALETIRKALADESDNVRAAAVVAAGELQQGAWQNIVLDGLKNDKRPPVLAAMRVIRLLSMPSAAAQVEKILVSTDQQVLGECLLTLTTLGVPAPAEKLAALLKSDSPVVRAFAAQNAVLLNAIAAAPLTNTLADMAQKDVPSARMYAVAALGKFAYDKSSAIITKAGTDDNPLVRCGAVQAAQYAGKAQPVTPFLNDPSVMVRLAAIKACGSLKIESSVDKLFELMYAAPVYVQGERIFADEQTRQAAIASLEQIGSDSVIAAAADTLAKQYALFQEADAKTKQAVKDKEQAAAAVRTAATNKTRQAGEIQRLAKERFVAAEQNETTARIAESTIASNLQSACRILGDMHSDKGFDTQVVIFNAMPPNAKVLIDIADNWSQFPQRRDVTLPLLRAKLNLLVKQLPAQFSRFPPPNLQYSTQVASAEILALGKLDDAESLSIMKAFIDFKIEGTGRIPSGECEAVMDAICNLTGDTVKKSARNMVLGVLRDRTAPYATRTRLYAAKSSARLGLTEAAPLLEKIVTTERENRNIMRTAAWAYHKLTGKTLTVGDPVISQGQWIVQKYQR